MALLFLHESDCILYEVADGAIRFRVIGEECKRRFNGVQPGQDYLSFVQPVRREQALLSMTNVLDYRCAMAVRNLQVLYRQGEEAFGVLALVKRRVRMLLDVERAMAKGARRDDALRKAGVAPNMLWKWQDQLGHYSPRELQRASSRLVLAESDVKGGRRIAPRWSVERAIRDIISR